MSRFVVLGISAFFHDSAAALLVDGTILAAVQEERFSRIKHDSSFPAQSIKYVLEETGMDLNDITAIAFYDKPLLKFERLLETYHAFAPIGLKNFLQSMPIWTKEKLFIRRELRKGLAPFGMFKGKLLFPEHHLSHAASAYFPSPYKRAAILTLDGVGEWATTTISEGMDNSIKVHRELHFPHSLGLLYSAFTHYLGFKVNEGEFKLMGLASYGERNSSKVRQLQQKIQDEIVDIREDGSLLLNMAYFNFATGLDMTQDKKWEELLGIARRSPDSNISQAHMDLAMASQSLAETIILALAKTTKKITGSKNLVLAGGVALNCVANGKILETGLFENIWIQPAAGDAGGALGAAYAAFHIFYNKQRKVDNADAMSHGYLGPEYSEKEIYRILNRYQAPHTYFRSFDQLSTFVAQNIAQGKIVGWFQGRMEFGPRALGNRSILANPLLPETQKTLNMKIKFREAFRPFAPSVLEEDSQVYFSLDVASPYMLLAAQVKKEMRFAEFKDSKKLGLYERLYKQRSLIPSVTHIDYSARIQTVSKDSNIRFWQLINDFKKISGHGLLVNTSFNIRDEPIVCSPEDAYMDFMKSGMDLLVMGNYLLDKSEQPSENPKLQMHKNLNH
ncbi:MAG: carbamoyltransferase family protein [Flagellimonas sp.]